jgi:hypothetical protein
LESGSLFRVAQDSLHALEIRGLHEIVARAGAKRGYSAVHRGMPGDNNNFRRFRLLELAYELNALAVRQAKVGQQDVGTLPPELDARIPQAVRSRNCKALHARNFLQPVYDVCIVVDYQSMCHVVPWTKSINRQRGRFKPNTVPAGDRPAGDFFTDRSVTTLSPPSTTGTIDA